MDTCLILVDLQNDYFPGGTMERSVSKKRLPMPRFFCVNSERQSGLLFMSSIFPPVLMRPFFWLRLMG